MRSVSVPLRVRFGETDAAGIVFSPTFFAWFDVGTHALLRGLDGTPARTADGRPRWPVPIVESGARFRAPLRMDDEIEIVSTVVEIGTSSFRIEHVVRAPDGGVAASGFEARVFIAQSEGRVAAAPLPADLRARLTGEA